MYIKLLKIFWPILVAGGLFAAGVFLYTKWENMVENNYTLEVEIEAHKRAQVAYADAINTWKNRVEQQGEATKVLMAKIEEGEEEREYLVNLFQRHNLTKLAISKPGMIETRINKGTKEAFDELEDITAR
jgi:hypothetical protein